MVKTHLDSLADTALTAATRFWFVLAVAGQLVFAFYVASFFGAAVGRNNILLLNRFMTHGYVAGDTPGNAAVIVHLISAIVILLAGAVQLVPGVRNRYPAFHRWVGRIYIPTAFAISIAGLYLLTVRRNIGDLSEHIGVGLNAVLIMLCAVMALRYAILRDFKTHRRWALRLFLVMSGNWFFRVGLTLSFLIFNGPFGFDPKTFEGPFLTFMAFAAYLVPLAVLEMYLLTERRAGAVGRVAMAGCLFVLTVAMGAGIAGTTMTRWMPAIRVAFDNRKSIAETLSATIASRGIDEAARQYRDLKTAEPAAYNFDERELNNLGYQLIRAAKIKEAIRVFQLNVEAYPQSSNVYDSLGEAYMNDGNEPEAIANYGKSLQLDPNNRNARLTILELKRPIRQ
jgi:uncharacterized membrane protein